MLDFAGSLYCCSNLKVTARIPHPPLRGTLPPGEGILLREALVQKCRKICKNVVANCRNWCYNGFVKIGSKPNTEYLTRKGYFKEENTK